MNATKKEFDKTLKLTKIALLLSGINLYPAQWNCILERIIHQLYYINILILYAIIFGEIYWVIDGIQTGKNFVEISLTSPCITISILGTIKSLPIYNHRDILVNVVDRLRDMHPEYKPSNDGDDDEAKEIRARNEIMKSSVKFLKSVVLLLSSICVVVIIMFCFSPMIVMGYEYFVMGISMIKYPYLVKYSFDAYNTGWWSLIYFLQIWATTIVCINIFGSDTLFYALCSYIGMHLRLLGVEFENIVTQNSYETKLNINLAVQKHQELIQMVVQTESIYSTSLLFNILTSSLLICLSAFNITVADDFRTIFAFITFLTMSFSQISLLCFFGDMIMSSSTEFSQSICMCRWYDSDVDLKKTILIALMRAQKPCRLRAANYADLNLGAFTTVRLFIAIALITDTVTSSFDILLRYERLVPLCTRIEETLVKSCDRIRILSRSWSYFALLKTIYN